MLTTPPADLVYRRLDAAFRDAMARRPQALHTSYYRFAGRPARLRVVGPGLARRVRAPLAHLRIPAPLRRPPELTIDLWDEAETGISCDGCTPHGNLRSPAAVARSADARLTARRKAGLWSAFDRRRGRIVAWIADARRLTQYQVARPLHSELLLWHHDRGVLPMHAALVARGGAGLLLPGPAGSGKSTTALTCMQAGFEYVSDDYVGIERTGAGRSADGGGRVDARAVVGYGFYSSTQVDPEQLDRFPELARHVVTAPETLPWEDKSLIMLADALPGRVDASARIDVIALPRVTGSAATRVRPAHAAEGLVYLAPSSLPMGPHVAVADGLRRLGRLLRSRPLRWLELGRDRSQIPRCVEELLQGAGAAARSDA